MSADHDSSSTRPQVTSEQGERFFSLLSDADRHRIWDRIMALPERKPVEPAPLTDFDKHFQTHVEPKLAGFVALGAYMVSLNLESFTEAHTRVMRQAVKYGATHLSDAAFWALDSWIDSALLVMIDQPPPEGLVTPEQLARIQRETP